MEGWCKVWQSLILTKELNKEQLQKIRVEGWRKAHELQLIEGVGVSCRLVHVNLKAFGVFFKLVLVYLGDWCVLQAGACKFRGLVSPSSW